jgi:DNA-binding response OmpR family regulator
VTETRRPRILIVEDEFHSKLLLERVLSNRNFEVFTAENGHQALDLLYSSGPVDVVLSDWMMPGMDGVQLCAEIKKREDLRRMFFILLTSRELTEDKVHALEAGVDDYLTKPCHQEELIARVRAGLRIRQLQEELLTLEKRVAVIQVAATAAHEINNPLTGVFGYLDLIQESIKSGADPKTLLDYLDRVAKQAERVRDIVAKLSTLRDVQTKPYIGKQEILDLHSGGKHS